MVFPAPRNVSIAHQGMINDLSQPVPPYRRASQRPSQGIRAEEQDQVSPCEGSETFEAGAGYIAFAGFRVAALMGKIHFQPIMLIVACLVASTASAVAIQDAQGWNGPGWYITGSAPIASQPVASPDYILFEGPHALRSDCAEVYDRLYSPVGVCRFLSAKPASFTDTGIQSR